MTNLNELVPDMARRPPVGWFAAGYLSGRRLTALGAYRLSPLAQATVRPVDRAADLISAALWLRQQPGLGGDRFGILGGLHGRTAADWVIQVFQIRSHPGVVHGFDNPSQQTLAWNDRSRHPTPARPGTISLLQGDFRTVG
jgi:hypothetical protein